MTTVSEPFDSNSDIEFHPQIIRLLVNGIQFELSEELIQKRVPRSLLALEDRRARYYSVDENAYVFDQPADAFEVLVYFICTGLLSRSLGVSSCKLYSVLSFFEIDNELLTFVKKGEHLVFDINWEKTNSSRESWIRQYFAPPFSHTAKIVNMFLFALTIISYSNLWFEYTFALPLFRSSPSSIDDNSSSQIQIPVGLDFRPSLQLSSYLPEIIYLLILLIEFVCRWIYTSKKLHYFFRYSTVIDLLSITSCIIYLLSIGIPIWFQNDTLVRFIAAFRFVRILKLSRYSTYIRQYVQTIICHYEISVLLFAVLSSFCMLFGGLTFGISLGDRQRTHSTPLDALYYAFETTTTVGFGTRIPATPFISWITMCCVLLGMISISLAVPFLAVYNFNLDNLEVEKDLIEQQQQQQH